MSAFLTIEEVVNLLGIDKSLVHRYRREGKYTTRQVQAKGGKGGLKYEIALSSLPQEAQNEWKKQQANAAINHLVDSNALVEKNEKTDIAKPETGTALAVKNQDLSQYTSAQRDAGLAIQTIMRWLENYPGKRQVALRELNKGYAAGTLPSPMMSALKRAKQKHSGKAKTLDILTQSTLDKWLARYKKQGNYIPMVKQADMSVKPWHAAAVALYCRPQKPSMASVIEALAKGYKPPPTEAQVRLFFEKFSRSDVLKGRHTGQQLRQLQYYKKRTSAGMEPWDEVHGDGWNTHLTAPHPITGEYVSHEVWDFHDVATKYVPPLSVGLTENYEVIAKGIENAIREGGVMAILMTDSTKIVKKNVKFSGNPVLSISDRAGITITHPVKVGSGQTNGIAENWHSWIDKEARELSTYQAKNMDSLTLRNTQRLTAKMVKAKAAGNTEEVISLSQQIAKTSPGYLFQSHQDMLDWLEKKRRKWNNHHHSSLPKIIDPVTGKKRHQSPQEALDAFKANGWMPVALDEEHLLELFRPRVRVKVRRGVVKPYGGKDGPRFRHKDLDHWEGLPVVVAYDIMDWRQVWVSDEKGVLICVAPFDADVPYRTQTAMEAAEEKRRTATIHRLNKKIETVQKRAGLDDGSVIEGESLRVIEFDPIETDLTPKISLDSMFAEAADEEEEAPRKMTLAETDLWLWGDVNNDDDESIDDRGVSDGN